MARSFKVKAITYPIFILIIILIIWYSFATLTGVFSVQWFSDKATVAAYQPSAEVTELVDASGMNQNGEFYFYTGTPQLNDSTEFNINCADVMDEQSIVLGCYTGKIFIFNVTDERIADVKSVTAAHEMLHAAYDRLGLWEKEHIDNLLNQQLEQTTDERILELVANYDRLEPGYRTNELHSIFGSEVRDLSSELAEYYERYFSNRDRVIAAAEGYEDVFNQMEQQAVMLEQNMTALGSEIDSYISEYDIAYETLSRDIDIFNSAVFYNEASFYTQRNSLLARQDQLSYQAAVINEKIDEYNQYVSELQNLGREAQLLQDNINSQSSSF